MMQERCRPTLGVSKNIQLRAMLLLTLLNGCVGLQIERAMRMGPEDWDTLGGSRTRANQSGSTLSPPLHEIWQYDAGGGITATPLVKDSIVVICTLKGELHAVNFQTGKRIGYINLDGAVTGTPVWNGTELYVPISTEDETIESVDLTNGSKNWIAKFGQSESSPLLYDKRLYVTTLKGDLYCINSVDGDEIWKFETATEDSRKPIRSSPATDGNLIIFGGDDGVVYAVDRSKGTETWTFKTDLSIFASPVIADGRVIVGSLDGNVYCMAAASGQLLWKFDAKSRIFGSASSNDTLAFVGTADGSCYALDLKSGSVVWKFGAKSVINSAPLVTPHLLYVGSLDKNLYVLDVRTGKEVWHFDAQGRIKVSPVIWNKTVLVTSEDNYVTALR